MFKNLIFDWSGTLCDDLHLTLDATNYVFAQYGRTPIDCDRFRAEFQLPYPEYYARILPEADLDELENHFRHAFRVSCEPVCILPNAREFMEYCRARGIRCFALTSVDANAFDAQCRELGMFDYFEAIHAGVRDKVAYIHSLLARHHLRPEETAFIGDMQHDIAAAHAAGIMGIAVLTGYNSTDQLARAKPDIMVPDLLVLKKVLEHAHRTLRDGDVIRLRSMELHCHIGVPDEERAERQKLLADIELTPPRRFSAMGEELDKTIDYASVAERLKQLAEGRESRLIETLADDMARCCIREFGALKATVEVHKFILPGIAATSVKTTAYTNFENER